jgi:hypothetical protein
MRVRYIIVRYFQDEISLLRSLNHTFLCAGIYRTMRFVVDRRGNVSNTDQTLLTYRLISAPMECLTSTILATVLSALP